MTDLSIVITSWNTRELLIGCLDALERELESERRRLGAGAISVELIVVDNGSTDGSAAAVRSAHPEVEVIALESNRGFAAGSNAGLERAEGRVLLLLNSDAIPEPGALARCVEVLDARPDAAAAGLQLLHPDGRLQNSIHAFPSAWHQLIPRALLELVAPGRFPSKRHRLTEPTIVEAVLGAAFFIRRKALDELGGLCEDYFFFLEETEWCLRAHRAGWVVIHVPDARALHRSGASSKARYPLATRIEFHRSLYRFLRRNRGRASVAFAIALRVTKAALILPLLALLAPFSRSARRRLDIVWGLLRWHASGMPASAGLSESAPGSGAPKR